jgi:hypothetical protein
VWKRHAAGGFTGLGSSPGSRIVSRFASTSGSGIGTADSSEIVYGCSGCRRAPRRRDLDDHAEVHDRDPIGDVANDGQVVRDEEVREVEPV